MMANVSLPCSARTISEPSSSPTPNIASSQPKPSPDGILACLDALAVRAACVVDVHVERDEHPLRTGVRPPLHTIDNRHALLDLVGH